MTKTNRRFRLVDAVYIVMMILPLMAGMTLQVLTKPQSEGISLSGARIFFTIPMPIQDFPVTESQINSFLVTVTIFFFCLYMIHGITQRANLKRQLIAEWVVEKVDNLVRENMGEVFMGYAPFIIAILALSAVSSLSSLIGLFPPTSDINVVGGWAVLVFILITYFKLKCGPLYYLKSFTEPVALLAPINFLSEFATPISMSFRHYGNILSGTVISTLLAVGLTGLSGLVFGWLPGLLGDLPWLRVGLPAVLSIYFDVFSGCLQAFIFAMLTMMNVAGAYPQEEYEARKQKKLLKKEVKELKKAKKAA